MSDLLLYALNMIALVVALIPVAYVLSLVVVVGATILGAIFGEDN